MLDSLIFSLNNRSGEDGCYLPTIKEELFTNDWLVIRGFRPKARLNYMDYLYEHGGEPNIVPKVGMKHTVNSNRNEVIGWNKAEYSNIKVKMPKCRGIGYGYTEVFSEGRKRVIVFSTGTLEFWLNGTIYEGNRYGYDYFGVPVILEDGVNRILVKTVRDDFSFRILPAPQPVIPIIYGDVTTPDIIVGKQLKSWMSIPIINTTEKTLDVRVRIVEDDIFEEKIVNIKGFVPMSIQKPPIQLVTKGVISQKNSPQFHELRLQVVSEGQDLETTVKLKVNNTPENGYIATFISSTDHSVQQYSVQPPSNFDPEKEYGLILALHGAAVGVGWTNSYSKKDWAYIVGPTNRREYGFDWQDWGRLNALETLNEALSLFKIDRKRIWLTGHSMGGHGTWSIGLQYPGMFAAIAPSAGWLGFDTYSRSQGKNESNICNKLQEITGNVDRGNSAVQSMENALNIPVYVLHGTADEVVSVEQARQGVKALRSLGYEVEYTEFPGGTHWWDNGSSPGGVACVDYPQMMEFLKRKTLNELPAKVIYKVWDLGVNNKAYWVTVDRQIVLFSETRVEAEVTGEHSVEVTCKNVKQLTLNLVEGLVKLGDLTLTINGSEQKINLDKYGHVTLHLTKEGTFLPGESEPRKGLRKTPAQYGAIKTGYFTPFIFVYGTKGGEEAKRLGMDLARLQQYRWWRQGNGTVRIISDADVDREIIENYNLILLGGPDCNMVTDRINTRLPIQLRDHKVYVGEHVYEGENLAAKFIYPNPLNTKKYVVVSEGNSLEGMRLSEMIPILFSGSFLPDYVIYDEKVRIKGLSEFLAAGFFGDDWEINDITGYFYEDEKGRPGV